MRICVVLVTLGGLLWAPSALAWTVAEVTSAEADITVDRTDRAAIVRLQGDVSVRGGWLTRLELQLVSDESALVREPRLFVLTEDDEVDSEPRVVRSIPLEHRFRKDGSLLLEFDRKDAPKKGRYRFEVLYRAKNFVRDGGRGAELRWSFPPWQSGLDDVEVRVHLHRRLGVDANDVDALEKFVRPAVRYDRDGYVSLSWMRPHLPRTLSWELGTRLRGLDAPSVPSSTKKPLPSEIDAADVQAPMSVAAPTAVTTKPRWWSLLGVLGALLLYSFRSSPCLRVSPAGHVPAAGVVGGANIDGLRHMSIYHLRIGASSGGRLVPYLHLEFAPHSAAAVALRRTFSSVQAEDHELTLPFREGLVDELLVMFARFADAHRKVLVDAEVERLAA